MTSSFPGTEPAPGLVVSPHLRTAAGSPLPVEVTLTNNAAAPRVLAVGALGVDAAWLPPLVRTPVLEPGQSTVVTLVLSPTLGTVPAHYPFAFTVQALDPDTGRPAGAPAVMVDSAIVVNPRNQLTLELRPRSLTTVSSRKMVLSLKNSGNEPARVSLDVQTSPRVRVRFRKQVIEVLPGATAQVRGRARLTRRRLFGGVDHHSYTVSASGTESLRHVEGSVTQRPLVGTMLLKALALLSVLAIWIGAAVIFIPQLANRIGDQPTETTTTTTKDGQGSGDDGGGGSGDSGGGGDSGGSGGGSGGDSAGSGGAGGKGGTQQAAATDKNEVALTGTVAGDQPGGVRVSLEPTSLVDEDAQGGVGVGVPSSQLGNTGMSLASSFLNQALPTTPPDRTATTTSDGSWAFAGVKKPGYYLLTFSKPGFQKRSFVVDSSSEAAATPLEVDLEAGGGALSGNVTGPRGRVGAATVTITDGTNTITTSTNSRGRIGHWSVRGLSTPGSYVVQVAKPGLSSESRMVKLGAGGTATADLKLRSGVASLVGKVRAVNESGKLAGVGGATVTVTSDDGAVRTATTLTEGDRARGSNARATAGFVGTYTVPGLPVPGTYVVTLSGPGLQTQTSTVDLKPGQSRAGIDADLVSASGSVAGTITGLNTDGTTEQIVGAGLTLSNADNTYKTMSTSQPAGSFLLDGVAPGTYSLQTQFFGYVSDHVTVTVQAGKTDTVNREITQVEGGVLAARSSVQGRAVDGSTSLPVTCPTTDTSCLVATVMEPGVGDDTGDDHTYRTEFLPTDEFTLPDPQDDPTGGLLPGLHTVTVSAPHYSSATASIQIGNDETANIGTLALLPAPKIVGTITAAAGTPSGNTCIWAVPLGGAAPPAGCDTSGSGAAHECQSVTATFGDGTTRVCAYLGGTGSYSIEVPSEGTYTVYVQSADVEYLSPNPSAILLESGVTRNQSFVLNRLGRVSVTVRKPGPTGALVPSTGTVVGPTPGGGTAVPASAATDGNGAMQFVSVAPGTYTIAAADSGLVGSRQFSVGLNQQEAVRLNLTNAIGAVIGQVTSTMDGATTNVAGATVRVTAPVGYGDDDSVTLGSVSMTTEAQGCFAIEKTASASPAIPAVGGCSWPATSGTDPSRGKLTFLSSAASAVQLSAPGYVSDTETNVTLSTDALNAFTLAPKPVPLGTVRPVVDPLDASFDWTQVAFTVQPTAGPTSAISVSATGTGTGSLVWNDTRVGAPNQVLPGTYVVSATRAGYLPATRTLNCPLATTPSITCAWQGGDLTMTKLSSLEVKAVDDGATSVPGARYILSRAGTPLETVVDTAGTGAVTFSGLDPRVDDGYRVEIRAAGYAFEDTSTLPLTCTPAPTGALDLELLPGTTTSCEAELTKLGTITGAVTGVPALPPATDPVTNLVGAEVRIQECTNVNTDGDCTAVDAANSFTGTTTGPGGTFTVTGTADRAGIDTATTWLVTATSPGYSLADPAGAGLPGAVVTTADFAAKVATADLTMYLDPVDVSVVLLDGSGTPFTGASVQLLRITSTGTEVVQSAVANGTAYDLTDIVPGAYVVSVSGGGLQAATQSATIITDGQVVSLSVVRAANVAQGTVTGSDLGPGALVNATVWVCATAACATAANGTDNIAMTKSTDAAGNFQIRTVPDGQFWVKVSKVGYRTQILGPFTFDHLIGAVPSLTPQLQVVQRNVKITVKRHWSNDALTGATVTLRSSGGTALAPVPLVVDGSDLSATFNQVTWGCWSVELDLPDRHFGNIGALQDRPADSAITGCTADDKLKVPSADDTTPATASLTLDEGRLDVRAAAAAVGILGHTAPATVSLTVKQGTTTVYTNTAFAVGTAWTDIWVPTGLTYVVTADRATPDPFWPPDQESVAVPSTKPAGDSVTADLSLLEQAATLKVTVTGGSGTDPQATLTLTGTTAVPPSYAAPSLTTGYKTTYTLGAGTWTVKADIGARTKTESITISQPQSAGPGGDYTLTIAVP